MAQMFSGRRLREARIAARAGRGMTAEELARLSGTSKSQILAYENDLRVPEPPRIKDLASALGVPPLDLADQSLMPEWTLASLRRASGLRIADVCKELRIKPHVYRRIESTGLTGQDCHGVTPRLAAMMNVLVQDVENALSNEPLYHSRITEISALIYELVQNFVRPGNLNMPQADETLVRQISAHLGRHALAVSKILGHEISTLRETHRRAMIEKATAHYGTTHEEQARASRRMNAENRVLANAETVLAQRLDVFFRSQLSAESWHLLAKLHLRQSRKSSNPTLLCSPSAAQEIGAFAEAAGKDERTVGITAEGQRHFISFKSWYDLQYPWIQKENEAYEQSLLSGRSELTTQLQQRFTEAETILFSFDGVLCRLFTSDGRAITSHIAQAAHNLQLFTSPATPADPVALLRSVVDQGSAQQIRELDEIVAGYELEAARRAVPLPGVVQLLESLSKGPWRMAVVTDHARSAVEAFLSPLQTERSTWTLEVYGRPRDPRLMKPNPHAVALAASQLGGTRSRTLLIGESVADALAARAAGVSFIGIAATRGRARMLRDAGATRLVATLSELAIAVQLCASGSADAPAMTGGLDYPPVDV
ncbi:helix-turn-helix domain-containing protein [Streptomyces sp. NBC_01261]|uniref:helix-turn-helix domain-containing protein n=1 Tax=Streptomyces sp. NBC_01261 TaxID=2903802 RepID=UPI002E33E6F8|nr:helix-turn-helix domain-containing protein [Streptomyces sp. NBC_01261]